MLRDEASGEIHTLRQNDTYSVMLRYEASGEIHTLRRNDTNKLSCSRHEASGEILPYVRMTSRTKHLEEILPYVGMTQINCHAAGTKHLQGIRTLRQNDIPDEASRGC